MINTPATPEALPPQEITDAKRAQIAERTGVFEEISKTALFTAEQSEAIVAAIEARDAATLDTAMQRFEAYATATFVLYAEIFGRAR